jgi:inosine/xanthosine triphosphate pyrophosphatase family protein
MNKAARSTLMSRKARFRAAIALARTTAREWCSEQGFTEGHLYQVLRGDRVSPDTMRKVDTFIAAQLDGKVAA